jgi:broad specificity phosphatase PhoE
MRRLILVRHAAPAKDRSVPARDWLLSSSGRAEADRLAELLAPLAPSVIISSDEPKAQQTAQPLAERLGLAVEVVAGLREHERRTVGYLDDEAFQATMARFFAEPDVLIFDASIRTDTCPKSSRLTRSSKGVGPSLAH